MPLKKHPKPVAKKTTAPAAKKKTAPKKQSQAEGVAKMYKKAKNDPFKIPGFKAGRGTE
jgi:hypothetical protein